MDNVKFGIVGLGNMGQGHILNFIAGGINNASITAVCDIKQDKLDWAKEALGEGVALYDNAEEMFSSADIDAVLIATPHYLHPPMAISALNHNLHILVEKPAGVYTKQVKEMNEAAQKSEKVFGIMFNQRTNPLYLKTRDLVSSGELGEIKRTIWIITDWYRTQKYYDSGEWRATWAGEGGGVLMNQSPHQLDLWQWICGMPVRVRAFCNIGKFHNIEVEDDVTAYVEYANGASMVLCLLMQCICPLGQMIGLICPLMTNYSMKSLPKRLNHPNRDSGIGFLSQELFSIIGNNSCNYMI